MSYEENYYKSHQIPTKPLILSCLLCISRHNISVYVFKFVLCLVLHGNEVHGSKPSKCRPLKLVITMMLLWVVKTSTFPISLPVLLFSRGMNGFEVPDSLRERAITALPCMATLLHLKSLIRERFENMCPKNRISNEWRRNV